MKLQVIDGSPHIDGKEKTLIDFFSDITKVVTRRTNQGFIITEELHNNEYFLSMEHASYEYMNNSHNSFTFDIVSQWDIMTKEQATEFLGKVTSFIKRVEFLLSDNVNHKFIIEVEI